MEQNKVSISTGIVWNSRIEDMEETLKEMGGDIKLIKLNEHIKTIFEMIGLDEIFEIYETEDEAVANFKQNVERK